MAGVVAMPSVIEDFDSQPCKKSRKDGGSPVVKTITNYFSPVPKPVEKPFSPPRSNNIMDYFSKRAPSCKEKSSSPEQTKEVGRPHSAEKHTNPETVKQLSQKRGRKTSKAARKLVGAEGVSSTEESSCVTVQESHESKDQAVDAVKSFGVLGSDTAALLAQLSAESCIPAETSEKHATKIITDEQAEKADHQEDGSKCVELKTALNTIELSPIVPSKYEAKQVKTTPQNTRKRQQQEAKQSEPEEKEAETENSLRDVSMEVNVDESSQLNSSTVRISFEDFVRSQSQDEAEEDREDEEVKDDDCKITNETKETNSGELDISKSEENMVPEELPSFQVSPRTVTIQAQVHVSPKQEPSKAVGKLASIFNRKKGGRSPAERFSSSHAEAGHQLPSLTTKRKSNVVLQEEDLELAVLESESIPKCSEVERKQFMAAFKQPTADVSKSKPVKSQSKQKQPGEKSLDAAEAETENLLTVEQTSQPSQGKKATKKKPGKKGGKKAKEGEETVSASPAAAGAAAEEETANMTVEVEEKRPESPITTSPSTPALRRSRREAVVQKASETTPTSSLRKTRRQTQTESKDTDVTALLQPEDGPIKMSTPKTRKSKYGVFQSELMCPPDDKESPIRIKFTRSSKNVSTSKAEGINASLPIKTSSESKKREQAKKLVQKAKVIQQNKKTVEEKSSLRRSSRTSIKRSYCDDEDSVICVDDQTASPLKEPEKMKTQKPLRSLNDVLGKAAPPGKASSGSKVGSHSQDKTARKVSAVISIFDDSSREGSENSQDDEQFRARREFLKSGLPESFKKQIAKTAATKEAYSASCSSFQLVTHTMQPPNDCSLWSLPWPESLLLCQLKELWSQTSKPLPAAGGSLCVKTAPACRSFCKRGSGWRPEISESVRQLLVGEFSTSNPQFPAQMFIARFLKKRADHQKQFTHSEEEAATREADEPAGGKRKRTSDEGENTAKVAKKRRSKHSEKSVSTAEPAKRGGRTRRSQRSRRGEEEEATEKTKPLLHPAPIPPEEDSVCIVEDLLSGEDTGKKDVVKEDVLWTDKYLPQHSSDIIGNTASVRRLHSWLKEWKLRADREERKKQKDKKKEDGSYDSDWDGGEDDSQDGEDMLCNTVLITGPTGVGKTAAVYACAQELGFKVFEVNASSQRSGRLILSQLKEATQSHQVDSQGVNAHKPTYFNSYGTSSSTGSLRPGSSPRKLNSPRRVVSSPRKPQSPRGAKKGSLTPVSLAKFFKTAASSTKEPQNTTKAASKKVGKANEAVLPVKSPPAPSPKEKGSEEQSKKTATSLILFEEVDVIFDEDSGFLAAIKTFMTTTKRPVVLTTSDPAFSSMFDGTFEEIHFKAPSLLNVSSYLQLLCLAEDMRTDPADIQSLLRLNGCDIRQSLLQLQFWTRSAGGRHGARPLVPTGKNETEVKPEPEEAADKSTLPPCDTGCTESKLSLLNNGQERDVLELLKSRSLVEEPGCWELLTDCKRRGVDLLYSNMEILLPLPLTHLTTSTRNPEQCASVSQDQPSASPKEQPSSTLPSTESADCSDSSSPIKMSNRMRKNKRRHHLPDQAGVDSDSDSEDGFLSLCKPQNAPQAKEEFKASERAKRKPLTPEERLKSLPVSQCLESIADFLDSMSYMDSLLDRANSHRGLSPVSVVIKDGMTDESSVEIDRGSSMTAAGLEIQAAVEALSFHKCRVSAEEAWEKTRQLEGELAKEVAAELSLPVAAHQECFSFTQDGSSQPQLVEQRREVMESLMLKGVFGTLGNSPAAALDYLPIMRCICRSEQLKEQGKVKRRFLHYLDAIHLGLEKRTLQLLAEDFP
ncbi:ATPase family AAA domain-containing protein 5 isoform X1 [Oreochromis niloticus]|uniref:ATPase family AAA domain-containing protein 5 isoform X1 n=1 Tax=Oreochromis niloticus TaxID=8128 RepID=UPI00025F8B93|nr:ATPase family AAA domain-containing protein 5 isoform X1 [Oreochromis niloticus]